jgi:hypothetical protein
LVLQAFKPAGEIVPPKSSDDGPTILGLSLQEIQAEMGKGFARGILRDLTSDGPIETLPPKLKSDLGYLVNRLRTGEKEKTS